MYKAKKEGRSAFRFHTAALSEAARERLSMENRLRRVIAHRALSVHFQPLVAGRDSCVVGVEALARWIPADGPEIPPGRFIPLAEENGTIIQIGAWILREACASVMRWSEACGFGGVVAVNLSARQFDQPDLVELVARTLSETGLPPERLELELTESMLMTDPARASATLFQLKNLGVKLSIDDFGTGYSSLSQLKRFPIDKLKIDRSFIEGLPDDRESRLITSAVIAMAHRLEITVLAEGVETAAQHDYLLEEGCDAFQGFMFSRPLPGNGALKFLSEWGKSAF